VRSFVISPALLRLVRLEPSPGGGLIQPASESVRAKLRLMVRRILLKYKYPQISGMAWWSWCYKQVEALGEGWA